MNQKTVVLNAAKMDYDGRLDLSQLSPDLTVYPDSAPEQILERVRGAAVVVTKELVIDASLLSRFPDSVKLICEAGTGYNNLAMDAARAKGITVCNIPAYSTQRVAQTALMLMLNLSSSMGAQLAMLARGDRSNFTDCLKVDHVELNGKTLGLVGTGNIGRAVARAAQALDMEVLGWARTPRPDAGGIRYVPMEELLRRSDYLSLHCPLTPETRHLIGADSLARMKPTAFLINTSRGALVDEAALIAALRAGTIAGAGLDVQETEPPAQDSPLYTMENVILTPHMGWKGLETRRRLVSLLAGNIRAFFGGRPINVVS
ncbi:D-2-hydroxyacid dehydrogenase [Pseudoflavonifractor sp. BIOML-A6]|nr:MULTISPECIES: NAD(P)-dependent oxidoreductase [unclassified Pseudoflavonifractor]MTQ98043.1 D-2-hydroxyacid dehydrogenase [Pseudoflavonifractor sp. BIOML-A16]MTR07495.1 D-2-hydroxyacid dehydrogenase [Pseudoflavonifractor sp. BIOML-A15]MTR73872.1 D-2-hydroxyacid dehydrogenase [Pseudoflavonifractor sp. BIOML-A18]MTS65615.1 D-2-hydroxyacid dehydrogenase [Pseudoflavonifractor sp. BIOML-A5]MTS72870.1 D-2-hydroxyacid dehydrogenase [Pseudoflavonifractor sp. BIOML-A8]MTS92151.1 D-2-hydroxyacid deh